MRSRRREGHERSKIGARINDRYHAQQKEGKLQVASAGSKVGAKTREKGFVGCYSLAYFSYVTKQAGG